MGGRVDGRLARGVAPCALHPLEEAVLVLQLLDAPVPHLWRDATTGVGEAAREDAYAWHCA